MTDLTNLANDIQAVKSDLANAISLKGVPCSTNDAFNSYSDKVNSIQSGYFAGVNLANITYLGAGANISFHGLGSYLTSAPMFNSLTSMAGSYAISFSNCTEITGTAEFPVLSTITNSDALSSAFNGCTNLTGVNFPALTQAIRFNWTFNNCVNLLSANFPNLVSANFTNTFWNCRSLESVNLNSLSSTTLYRAFYNCSNLVSISFPSLTKFYSAADSAFDGCNNLETVDFSNLSDIGTTANSMFQWAFANCPKLKSFNLPKCIINSPGSTFLGAFQNCTSLESFSVNAITNFGLGGYGSSVFEGAFQNCTNLVSFKPNIETSSPYWPSSAFQNCFNGCTNFADVSFLESCQGTGWGGTFINCFRNCFALNNQHIYFNSFSYTASNYQSFINMIYGVSNCTVHFPSSMQSIMSSWAPVQAGFGGTNTTVLFDL